MYLEEHRVLQENCKRNLVSRYLKSDTIAAFQSNFGYMDEMGQELNTNLYQ